MSRQRDPFLWKPRAGSFDNRKVDLTRCRAMVGGEAMTFHQCSRKGVKPYTMNDGTEVLFCKQHHPDKRRALEAKHAETAARNKAARDWNEEELRLTEWLEKEVLAAHKKRELPNNVRVVVDALLTHRKAKR